MTLQTVRITQITPREPGTKRPWVFKDGNNNTYKTFAPQLAAQIMSDYKDSALSLEYETQTNGTYTDNIIKAVTVVEATAPRPNGQPTGTGWRPDPARDLKDSEKNVYIVREACLSSAVRLAVGMLGRGHEPLTDEQEQHFINSTVMLADEFVKWVYASGSKNSGKVDEKAVQELFPGAEKIGPKSRAS